MARQDFPDCKFHFPPRWSLSFGGKGGVWHKASVSEKGGGGPPPCGKPSEHMPDQTLSSTRPQMLLGPVEDVADMPRLNWPVRRGNFDGSFAARAMDRCAHFHCLGPCLKHRGGGGSSLEPQAGLERWHSPALRTHWGRFQRHRRSGTAGYWCAAQIMQRLSSTEGHEATWLSCHLAVTLRFATSVCPLSRDQMEQAPTEPHAGRSTFLLSSGGAGGRVLLRGLWYGADCH